MHRDAVVTAIERWGAALKGGGRGKSVDRNGDDVAVTDEGAFAGGGLFDMKVAADRLGVDEVAAVAV